MDVPEYRPTERRPIATRDLAVSRGAARRLAMWNVSPNAISLAGMLAAIFAGMLFTVTAWQPWWGAAAWLGGAFLAQMRLVANMLDGMVAIERGVASPVGELYNEVPDRISDAAIFIGLGYSAGGSPVLGYLAALAAVFTAYVRAVAKVAGAGQDFCGPMAKPQRMFVVTLLGAYCGLAPATWQPRWMPEIGLPAAALALIAAGSLGTALRRLWRAAKKLKGPQP